MKRESWGPLIGNIKDAVEADATSGNPKIGRESRAEIHAALAFVDSCRDAWRNYAMHEASKHSGYEAVTILRSVTSFLVRVAPLATTSP